MNVLNESKPLHLIKHPRNKLTEQSMQVLRETNIIDYDLDSLESTYDSLDEQYLPKKFSSLSGTISRHSSERSFSDICDEFSVFLNEDEPNDSLVARSESHSKGKLHQKKEKTSKIPDPNIGNSSSDSGTFMDASKTTEKEITIDFNVADAYVKETDLTEMDTFPQSVITENKDQQKDEMLPSRSGDVERKCKSLDSDNNEFIFQDIESEFFETDCEGIHQEDESKTSIRSRQTSEELSLQFHDIESEFFETDCEGSVQERKSNTAIKSGRSSEKLTFQFQDIESEYFETDTEVKEENNKIKALRAKVFNEGSNTNTLRKKCASQKNSSVEYETTDIDRKYFQDVGSDYFDEEDLISPSKTYPITRTFSSQKYHTKQKAATNLHLKLDKTANLSNSLLRSTINELEKALSDSNLLLTKRDLEIQELRKQNNELQNDFENEVESHSQLKLMFLEKEALLAEREKSIESLNDQINTLTDELNEIRLNKWNNEESFSWNGSIESHESSDDSIVINGLFSDNMNNYKPKCRYKSKIESSNVRLSPENDRKFQSNSKRKCPRSQHKRDNKSDTINTNEINMKNFESKEYLKKTVRDEKLSQSELHAHLRMKFMRDAFFYYMIGFHPDEQINAILAILDYGDKRQDFVLEAHKMKKTGKKINVSKISTRGLTFVQEIKDGNV